MLNLMPDGLYGMHRNVSRAMDLQKRLLAFSDLAWTYETQRILEFLMRKRGYAPYCFRPCGRASLAPATVNHIEAELASKLAAIEEAL